jgi:lantibiotic modifying enzyme
LSSPSSPLDTASAIAVRLLDEAIWDGARCGWVGALTTPEGQPKAYGDAGPDLYGGSAGIGLLLGELAVATGEPRARRTALGAIRHGLAGAGRIHPDLAIGLYSGRLGVALAAARVGAILTDEEMLDGAADLVRRIAKESGDIGHFDLIAGRAGGVVALLALASLLDDPTLIAWAARLGEELVSTAERTAGGCCWRAPASGAAAALSGLSHGAAGVGYALLELYGVTRVASFRDTALAAFAYERNLFDSAAGNWLDLSNAAAERRFGFAWCHGAPGITLTRLHALELLSDADCHAEAIAGTRTTREAVLTELATGSGNYSLCHGLAGNAEVLLHSSSFLGEGRDVDRILALKVADAGVERYSRSGQWPSGLPGSEAPGLMLGLAGTALFYLRLHDASVPSVLLPASLAGTSARVPRFKG